jgi:hypothetical protein
MKVKLHNCCTVCGANCTTVRTDLNIVYTLHYMHTNCLRLHQPLINLFYRTRYITFCYEVGARQRLRQGDSYLTIRFLVHQLAENTCPKVHLRQTKKAQRGSRGIALPLT